MNQVMMNDNNENDNEMRNVSQPGQEARELSELGAID